MLRLAVPIGRSASVAERSDEHRPEPSSSKRWSSISRVQRNEWTAVFLGALYFFFLLAAYYVIRPVREQFSGQVGSQMLPAFYAATFVATLVLTPIFGALVARYKRRRFVPIVYFFFLLGMFALIPLYVMRDNLGPRMLGGILFVWVSVFNLFVVAVFWSFMADLFDVDQGKRLFPLIALGGPVGAIVGPILTRELVPIVHVGGLLAVSAGLLAAAICCVLLLLRWSRANPVRGDERRDERIIGGSIMAGAALTFFSPLLLRMGVLMLLGDGVGTVIYALLADYSHEHFVNEIQRTDFAAGVDLYTNVAQAAMQVLVTRELMTRLGAVWAVVLDAAIKALMLIGLIAFGGAWIAAVAVVTRASMYGVFKPAADSLYTLVDAEARYKAKNFIDTVVWRFGDVVITSGLTALRGVGFGVAGLAALSTLAAFGSGYVGWRIGRAPEMRAQFTTRA
jgi:AAA family ATP:ADP antiporter